MKSEYFNTTFYKNIALLFYAVANADKKIVIEEKRSIIQVIKNSSVELGNLSDNEETIYEVLRNLIKDNVTSDEAFEQFSHYATTNKHIFAKETSDALIHAAHKIASSKSDKNKSELIFLAKLNILLSSLHEKK